MRIGVEVSVFAMTPSSAQRWHSNTSLHTSVPRIAKLYVMHAHLNIHFVRSPKTASNFLKKTNPSLSKSQWQFPLSNMLRHPSLFAAAAIFPIGWSALRQTSTADDVAGCRYRTLDQPTICALMLEILEHVLLQLANS